MEKTIKIVMNDDKNIQIYLNNEIKKTIPVNDRSINAREILESLDYIFDDTYIIVNENEAGKDPSVFNAILKLYDDIANDINSFSEEDEKLKE